MHTSDYRGTLHNAAALILFMEHNDSPEIHRLRETTHQPGYTGQQATSTERNGQQFSDHKEYTDALIERGISSVCANLEVMSNQVEAMRGFKDREDYNRWCVEEFGLRKSPQDYIRLVQDDPTLLPEAVDAWQVMVAEKMHLQGMVAPSLRPLIEKIDSAEGLTTEDGKKSPFNLATVFRAAYLQEEVSELSDFIGKLNFETDIAVEIQPYSCPAREDNKVHEDILLLIAPQHNSPVSAKDMGTKICDIINEGKNLREIEAFITEDAKGLQEGEVAVVIAPRRNRHLTIGDVGAACDHIIDELNRQRTRWTPPPENGQSTRPPPRP